MQTMEECNDIIIIPKACSACDPFLKVPGTSKCPSSRVFK